MIWLSGLGTVLGGGGVGRGLCLLWTSVSQCLGPVNLKSARWSPDTVMDTPPEHGKGTQREDPNELWDGIILNNRRDECGIRWIAISNHLHCTCSEGSTRRCFPLSLPPSCPAPFLGTDQLPWDPLLQKRLQRHRNIRMDSRSCSGDKRWKGVLTCAGIQKPGRAHRRWCRLCQCGCRWRRCPATPPPRCIDTPVFLLTSKTCGSKQHLWVCDVSWMRCSERDTYHHSCCSWHPLPGTPASWNSHSLHSH